MRPGSLIVAAALLLAPAGPVLAGHGVPVYESYKGAQAYARQRARKVCHQERGYRAYERKRLARLGLGRSDQPPAWAYASPWGACTAPGLF